LQDLAGLIYFSETGIRNLKTFSLLHKTHEDLKKVLFHW
jgi:hypothetical protein